MWFESSEEHCKRLSDNLVEAQERYKLAEKSRGDVWQRLKAEGLRISEVMDHPDRIWANSLCDKLGTIKWEAENRFSTCVDYYTDIFIRTGKDKTGGHLSCKR